MVDINESIQNVEKTIGRQLTEKEKQAVNAFGQFFNLIVSKDTEKTEEK